MRTNGNTLPIAADGIHERYEEAKDNIRDSSLRPLIELGESWFKKNERYQLLDGETFGQAEFHKAQSELSFWHRPFYSPDFETAGKVFHKRMEDQFRDLVFEAQGKDNEGAPRASNTSAQARAALAYIILSGGRPFRSEADRSRAIQMAADGIFD